MNETSSAQQPVAQPLVSAVLVSYHRPADALRALDSILAQSYENLELIIVDDGTRDFLDQNKINLAIQSKRPKLHWQQIRTNGAGANAARMAGLKQCQGDWVAFLDDDDQWFEKKIETQIKSGLAEKVFAIGCNYKTDHHDVILSDNTSAQIPQALKLSNVLGGFSLPLICRSNLLQALPFDTSLKSCQDWDLWLRLSQQTYNRTQWKAFAYIVPQVLVHIHQDSAHRISASRSKRFWGQWSFLKKHRSLLTPSQRLFHGLRALQGLAAGTPLFQWTRPVGKLYRKLWTLFGGQSYHYTESNNANQNSSRHLERQK